MIKVKYYMTDGEENFFRNKTDGVTMGDSAKEEVAYTLQRIRNGDKFGKNLKLYRVVFEEVETYKINEEPTLTKE